MASTYYVLQGDDILQTRQNIVIDDQAMIATFIASNFKLVQDLTTKLLDNKAQEMGYDNAVSASSYTGFANAFQAESQQFLAWRAAVWDSLYTTMANIQSGTIPLPPNVDTIMAALPRYEDFAPNP